MTTSRRPLTRIPGAMALVAVVLLGVGPAESRQPPPAAATEPAAVSAVTIHGRTDSFGQLGSTLPSGQPLAQQAVSGWGLPPGTQAGATTVAGDGTVFVAGRDHHGGAGPATGERLAIGAYQPESGAYTTIPLATTTGTERIVDDSGDPLAPSVSHLATIGGGAAVAFTVGPTPARHDVGADGAWPVLGILTKVDGGWGVAAGAGWVNQWTGADLRASQPPVSERACPPEPVLRGGSDCRGLRELVAMPHSGALIVAQTGLPGWYNGSLLALRVTGPDREGRYTATVTDHYVYPNVQDPETGDFLELELRELRADPTSESGDERFVVGLQDLSGTDTDRPAVVQEFSYDTGTGAIAPVSAPIIPGDRAGADGPFYGYSATLYDQQGNLWAARHRWLAGGKLAVYAATDAGRKLGGPGCPFDPAAAMASYVTTIDDRTVWGQACPPDYDIVQAQDLAAITSLVQGPAGEVVGLALIGTLVPVRISGRDVDGGGLAFEVGNLVDTAPRLLPTGTGGVLEHRFGAFDPAGRLWFVAAQAQPRETGGVVDQWLYEVDTAALFDPAPVALPEVPGQLATVHVGHTVTTETENVDGSWATVDVGSLAHFRQCTDGVSSAGCSYDGVPGDGFLLSHSSGLGFISGEVGYRVAVPASGRYRVAYRVTTFPNVTDAEITLSANGQTLTTLVATGGQWRTVPQPELVELPAGVHTIRLSAVDGHGGWHLSWFTLQRA